MYQASLTHINCVSVSGSQVLTRNCVSRKPWHAFDRVAFRKPPMQKPLDFKMSALWNGLPGAFRVQTDTYTDAEDRLPHVRPAAARTGDGDSFFKYFLVDPSWLSRQQLLALHHDTLHITMTCASCRAGGNSVGRTRSGLPIRSSGAAHRGVLAGVRSLRASTTVARSTQHHDTIRIHCRALLVF